VAILCLSLICAPGARGEDQPLWEAGLGFTVLDFADYRGSDERTRYLLPVPYALYRGSILRVDRDRVRGMFFEADRVSIQLSVSGSVPVNSSDNAARKGMPDLDPTLEIGPSLELRLYESAASRVTVDLRLPARTVIATDIRHTHNVGWVFQPQINFDFRNVFQDAEWKTGLALGPVYGDKRYHNYFYGVTPEFATTQRPAYVAESGYAGGQVIATVSRRYQRMWVGGFVRWDSVAGAAFEPSPLVRQNNTVTTGLAVVWRLQQSQRLVPVRD
jgi:outer membrane scaffolding protein for murein synthesis (MipA/OmpV family)